MRNGRNSILKIVFGPFQLREQRLHGTIVCPGPTRQMELLLHQNLNSTSAFVFTGYRPKQLSAKSMILLLRKMNKTATVHGFRSSFRDYCGNETEFSREHVEQCLAHQVGNNVERAYRR